MTLEELEKSLPHGLHDGGLRALRIDYTHAEMILDVEIDVGKTITVLRRATLFLSGFLFCAMAPPDRRYLGEGTGSSLLISAGPFAGMKAPPPDLPLNLPEGVFGYCIYVNDDNRVIYIAARDARLEWQEAEPLPGSQP